MKTHILILVVVFIALSCNITALFSQSNTISYNCDTLQDGTLSYNFYNSDSSSILNNLVFPEEGSNNEIFISNGALPEDESFLYKDNFRKNIFLPTDYGGCLPLDVCYNSSSNKYYIYGGLNVIVLDGTTLLKVDEIRVSNYSMPGNGFTWSTSGNNRLVYNSQYNKIFCITEISELVVINCTTNEVESTLNMYGIDNPLATSIIVDNSGNYVYWFANTWFNQSKVCKVSCQTNSILNQYSLTGQISDMKINSFDSKLFVSTYNISTTGGMKVLNPSNLFLMSSFGPTTLGKIIINDQTGRLYCHNLSNSRLYCYDANTYTFQNYIQTSFSRLIHGVLNPNTNNLYFTGKNGVEEYGLSIINTNTNQETHVQYEDFLISLFYNSSKNVVYAGGSDIILKVDHNNTIVSTSNGGNKSFNLTIGPNHGIVSANKTEGNITIFNSSLNLTNTIKTGSAVSLGCYNDQSNKVYFVENGEYLYILDGATSNVIDEYPLGNKIRDIQYNSFNNKVYISTVGNNVIPIDGNTNQILTSEILNLGNFASKLFISSNNKLYASSYNSIYIYNLYTSQLLNTISNTGGWSSAITENIAEGRVFFTMSSQDKVLVIDGSTNNISSQINVGDSPSDIIYNPANESIYVANRASSTVQIIENNSIVKTFNIDTPRYFEYDEWDEKVYVLGISEVTSIIDNKIISSISLPTAANAGFAYNNLNNRIYIHSLVGQDFNIQLLSIDCTIDEIVSITSLDAKTVPGIISYIALNSLVFNSANNVMYCGNKGFCNISVVDCYTDRLNWNFDWRWLSFPRMQRVGNDPFSSEDELSYLNVYPQKEFTLYLGTSLNTLKQWELAIPPQWNGFLNYVYSTSGYKLNIAPVEGPTPIITLYGSKLDPETEMTIPANSIKRAIGYFLEESQYPWQAFPENLYNGSLTRIEAQYWTMVKDEYSEGWIVTGKVTPIKYGDMVIVKQNGTSPVSFSWNNPNESQEEVLLSLPQNYEWEEQASYTPFYIETDSTSDIAEIAVLVDGECKGATVRSPGDTIVEVDGYLEGLPAGSVIEFETWNGYKSKNINAESYAVFNPSTREKEMRKIYIGESQDYYKVSFKNSDKGLKIPSVNNISCKPNPFTNETKISIQLNQTQHISIEIYNISGVCVKSLINGILPEGYYTFSWTGENNNGNKVKKGIYFYKIMTNKGISRSDKIIFIK